MTQRERQERAARACPWCESEDVRFVQRGYAGLTDEINQYLICASCGKTTYELISKNAREMRLGRYKPGDMYQDRTQSTQYRISRVLRVGQNEFLIYLRPVAAKASVAR